MLLQQVFTPGRIKVGIESEDKDELFEELVEVLARDGGKDFPRSQVLSALRDREAKMSTGIKKGIAIPHGKVEGLPHIIGVLGVSRGGIDYDSLDGDDVYLVFMLLSPLKEAELHLSLLRHLAMLLDNPHFYTRLVAAESSDAAHKIIKDFEDQQSLEL